MPSTDRRSFVASLGTVATVGLAGCGLGGESEPPAGSLRIENNHDLPHGIRMRVTGVGSEPGDGPNEVEGDVVVPAPQRQLTAGTVVQPGETQTYETVFTEPVWYGVAFHVDDESPGNAGKVKYNPAPTDGAQGSVLGGRVGQGGEFTWVVTATNDLGPFQA